MLTAVGVTEIRPQRIADALEIDLNLARKLTGVVQTSDRFAAGRDLPGLSGMKILGRAASSMGVSDDIVGRLERATTAYHELTRVYAGDRASLDSMLGHLATSGTERNDLAVRRQSFRSNSSIFGVQTRIQTDTMIVMPSMVMGDAADVALVRGFSDFQRLANGRNWIISRSNLVTRDPNRAFESHREALDPESRDEHKVPLLTEFCDLPLPCCRRVVLPSGAVQDVLTGAEVGLRGRTTLFTSEVVRPAFIWPDQQRHDYRVAPRCHTPAEIMLVDVLAHPETPLAAEPDFFITSEIDGSDSNYMSSDDLMRLPVCESLEQREASADALMFPDFPRYADAVLRATEFVGLDINELVMRRLVVRYPPMPSMMFLHWVYDPSSSTKLGQTP
ncbi:MAG: hypothetical protein AAGI30_07170 [Planctomycetota bacterium]